MFPLCDESDAVGYFELTPHTPAYRCKYKLVHQMCVDLQLKVVPNKCTFYSCLNKLNKLIQLF